MIGAGGMCAPRPELGSGGPVLEAESLTIRVGRRTLIRNLTWSHRPGSVAWVVGGNGVGKSCFLRTLAGLKRPSTGFVRLGASRPDECSVRYLHPSMTAPPEVQAGRVRELTHVLARKKPDLETLKLLGAGGLGNEPSVARLSTGEVRRLLLGVVLTGNAGFYFLDEPYEHLSGEARDTLTGLLLKRAVRCVVVVATHQPLVREGLEGQVLRLDGRGGAAW